MARDDDTSRPASWAHGSPWSEALPNRYSPISRDRRTDVVVVGAGLTGLLTATMLRRSGAHVIVLDRHTIGGVATRNTTAKISALQGTVYTELVSRRDAEVAAAYAAAQLDAVRGIRALIEDVGIDCDLTEATAYTYATDPEAADRARAELEHATRAGIPARWIGTTELPFPVEGAVTLDGQLHFDPGACCAGLAAALDPDQVGAHTAVIGVAEDGDGCRVEIAGGVTIRADHAVLATQAPIADPGLLANRCAPVQSYAIAAEIEGAVPAGLYLSCDETVHSLRPILRPGGTQLVIGGEGHPVDGSARPDRWDALADWAERHFGPVAVTHRWATHDLVTTDRMPFVGRLAPGADRRWVATGFAKWGMTNAYVAARVISEAIGGGSTPWSDAFDATRLGATMNRHLVGIGRTATQHLVVDRIRRRPEPRCTHQGCVLRHDDALDTWDCPCHGSRFATDGDVIQGPATRPLPT